MAEITRSRQGGVDQTLQWSLEAWRGLPEVAEEVPRWSSIERLDFLYEWPLEEGRLAELRAQADAGALTTSQEVRFRELEDVVMDNRPIIEDLHKRYIG